MSQQGEMPDLEDITEDEAILDMHLNSLDSKAEANLYQLRIVTKDNTIKELKSNKLKTLFQQGKIKFVRTNKTKISNKIIEELIMKEKLECKEADLFVFSGGRFKGIRNGQEWDRIQK